ncbi:MAG: stalk domain-containing protein [Eubacteriales bacterium]
MQHKRKKMGYLLAVVLLLVTLNPIPVAAINPQPEPPGKPGEIQVFIDGSPLSMDVAPLLEQDRTLVPLRSIFEALGATVEWYESDQSVMAKKGNMAVRLQIGSNAALKNEVQVMLEVPPRIVNDRTLVPLRFVSEALGAQVGWDGINQIVSITSGSVQSVSPGSSQQAAGQPAQSTPSTGADLSGAVHNYLLLPVTDKKFDAAYIYRDKFLAKPLDPSKYLPDKPLKVDYSQYVTLTGNQDGWGGCIGRSIVHSIDILKEMEHPYTPDLSFWYLHSRQDQLLQNSMPDSNVTKTLLENNGLCPESTLPTDYDKAKLVTDDYGNPVKWDFSAMPQPSAASNAEANLYRIKTYSDPVTPTVDGVKSLLCRYGPVIAAGSIPILLGPNPPEGHCVTIVGYDDSAGAFKCLNSWGDQWGPNGNGFFTIPYDQLTDNFSSLIFFENLPFDRSSTGHAYSARIRIHHQNERNDLTVKIGVEGKEPLMIWNRPNDEPKPHPYDNSKNLCIDVPLPASEWPPGYYHRWYVEVTDGGKDNLTAQIEEITLARLYHNPNNHTVGKFQTETYKPDQTNIAVPDGGSIKVYIPTANPTKPPLEVKDLLPYTLTIQPAGLSTPEGEKIVLTGKLAALSPSSRSVPAAGKEVKIYKLVPEFCVNKPPRWIQAGTVVTAADGSYTFEIEPQPVLGKHVYAAAFIEGDGKVLASSEEAIIDLSSKMKYPLEQLQKPKIPGEPTPDPFQQTIQPEQSIQPVQPGIELNVPNTLTR